MLSESSKNQGTVLTCVVSRSTGVARAYSPHIRDFFREYSRLIFRCKCGTASLAATTWFFRTGSGLFSNDASAPSNTAVLRSQDLHF